MEQFNPEKQAADNLEKDFITLEIGSAELPIIYGRSDRAKDFNDNPHRRYIGIDLRRDAVHEGKEGVEKLLTDEAKKRTLFAVASGGRLPIRG